MLCTFKEFTRENGGCIHQRYCRTYADEANRVGQADEAKATEGIV